MTSSNAVLVFGATGVIGRYIISALTQAQPSFQRVGIFTSASTAQNKSEQIQKLKDANVEIHVGDIESEDDVSKALEGYDTVVSAVGRNVIASQIKLVDVAEKSSSVKRFYSSEYGTDIEYDASSANEKPHQQKLKVRAHIKKLQDEGKSKVEYTYLVTGPFADMYIMAPPKGAEKAGGFDVKAKKAIVPDDGNGKISLTMMEDVGKMVVSSLRHPKPSANRALKVNSFTTTPNDIVAEFEKQTGTKWSVEYTSLPELKEAEEQAWKQEDPRATVFTLRRIWAQGKTLYEKRDNEGIGATDMIGLEQAVKEAIEAQSSML